MNKNLRLVCLGEALIDFTPIENSAYIPNVGGAPYNVAACAAKFGAAVNFVGTVGEDPFGTMIKSTADLLGVNTSALFYKEGSTTHSFVSLDANGERDFVFCRDADVKLNTEDVKKALSVDFSMLHIGSLSLTSEPIKSAALYAVDEAKRRNVFVSFDPNYRALLWRKESDFTDICNALLPKVDVLKVSEEEAIMITKIASAEEALRNLSKNRIVFMTCGEKGAYYGYCGNIGFVEAMKVKAVDTTGAGDIFYGVALAELLKNSFNTDELKGITEKACYYASKSTEKFGAVSSIPEICN